MKRKYQISSALLHDWAWFGLAWGQRRYIHRGEIAQPGDIIWCRQWGTGGFSHPAGGASVTWDLHVTSLLLRGAKHVAWCAFICDIFAPPFMTSCCGQSSRMASVSEMTSYWPASLFCHSLLIVQHGTRFEYWYQSKTFNIPCVCSTSLEPVDYFALHDSALYLCFIVFQTGYSKINLFALTHGIPAFTVRQRCDYINMSLKPSHWRYKMEICRPVIFVGQRHTMQTSVFVRKMFPRLTHTFHEINMQLITFFCF